MPHVTLAGDASGDYVIEEQRPDGRLLLAPEPAWKSELREDSVQLLSRDEAIAWVNDRADQMLPRDGEG